MEPERGKEADGYTEEVEGKDDEVTSGGVVPSRSDAVVNIDGGQGEEEEAEEVGVDVYWEMLESEREKR